MYRGRLSGVPYQIFLVFLYRAYLDALAEHVWHLVLPKSRYDHSNLCERTWSCETRIPFGKVKHCHPQLVEYPVVECLLCCIDVPSRWQKHRESMLHRNYWQCRPMGQSSMMGAWSSGSLVVGKGQESTTPWAEAFRQEAKRFNLDVDGFFPAVRARESFVCTRQHDWLLDMHPWLDQYVVVLCIPCCSCQWFHRG